MPKITSDAVSPSAELFYQDSGGDGPPVVLIHGWPLSGAMWEPQAGPLMEAGYRVITYDRRGFGHSAFPFGGYDYDTFAGDLKALLDELDLREATLVGFSMGGGEVARYIGRYGTDRVARAVLVSAVTPYMLQTDDNPSGVDAGVFEDMKANLKKDRPHFLDGFGKTFVGWGLLDHPVSDEMLHYAWTIAVHAQPYATIQCVDAFGKTDFRDDVRAMSVPTLVVHGGGDDIVPLETGGEAAARLLPNGRLEVFEGAPHGLTMTHAARFNDLLLAFLRSDGGAQSAAAAPATGAMPGTMPPAPAGF